MSIAYSTNIMSIVNTVERAAKVATGQIEDFRAVLDNAPQVSGFTFPPIVQRGIDIAGQFGVKVPTAEELTGIANKEIDRLFGKVREPILKQLAAVESALKGLEGLEPKDIIKKLEWLL